MDYLLRANTENNFLATKDNHFILNNLHLFRNFENNLELNSDSVLITTKNGKKFRGLVSKTDFDGYFIKIENNREIYISNLEINTIKFLESSIIICHQKLAIRYLKIASIVQPIEAFHQQSKTPSNPSNDVWDNTNAEFEESAITNTKTNPKETTLKKTQEPLSIISFIIVILTPFCRIYLILAFIFKYCKFNKIKKNPEKYKGNDWQDLTLIKVLLF